MQSTLAYRRNQTPKSKEIEKLIIRSQGNILIDRSDVTQLCELLGLHDGMDYLRAILVLSNKIKFRSNIDPDHMIHGIINCYRTRINLSNLSVVMRLSEFERIYMRYCGSSQVKLIRIQQFMQLLQRTGAFTAAKR